MKRNLLIGVIGIILTLSVFSFFYIYRSITGKGILGESVEVYYSPTCGCCVQYIRYLSDRGFNVKQIRTDDLNSIKSDLNIPNSMWSCHTMKIRGYFVEGHVPIEAIQKLLEEQPKIDGIALPNMPVGSPGMPGAKTEPFTIYSVLNGEVNEFARI